jgi:hypothetical protein
MYHDAFNPDVDEVNDLKRRYVNGGVGDVEVKDKPSGRFVLAERLQVADLTVQD